LDLKERAALRRSLETHLSSVLADDSQDNGQAQPRANTRGLSSEKRIEDARLDGLRNARTVIFHFEENPALAECARAETNVSLFVLFLERVAGIAHEIHQDLLQLPRVAVNKGKSGIEIELD